MREQECGLRPQRSVGREAAIRCLAANEKFLGPIFDESGILRFFFVYNSRLKIFHYLLDETVRVADDLYAATGTDRILIGDEPALPSIATIMSIAKSSLACTRQFTREQLFRRPVHQLPENFIQGRSCGRRSWRPTRASKAKSID
jgi:hypothetical protein